MFGNISTHLYHSSSFLEGRSECGQQMSQAREKGSLGQGKVHWLTGYSWPAVDVTREEVMRHTGHLAAQVTVLSRQH